MTGDWWTIPTDIQTPIPLQSASELSSYHMPKVHYKCTMNNSTGKMRKRNDVAPG